MTGQLTPPRRGRQLVRRRPGAAGQQGVDQPSRDPLADLQPPLHRRPADRRRHLGVLLSGVETPPLLQAPGCDESAVRAAPPGRPGPARLLRSRRLVRRRLPALAENPQAQANVIARNLAQAGDDLAKMRRLNPADPVYSALSLSAIASTLTVLALQLQEPERPAIPGLPDGWSLELHQNKTDDRRWGYILAGPDPALRHESRCLWKYEATALAEGVRHAIRLNTARNENGKES